MRKSSYLESRIKKLLASDKKYQKSDLDLMARVWYDDLMMINYGIPDKCSAVHFLNLLRDGKLTSWDSATRCRRKLQQKFPELRDEKTHKGRKNMETVMRESKQFY